MSEAGRLSEAFGWVWEKICLEIQANAAELGLYLHPKVAVSYEVHRQ